MFPYFCFLCGAEPSVGWNHVIPFKQSSKKVSLNAIDSDKEKEI
jgi:hypothetical protein